MIWKIFGIIAAIIGIILFMIPRLLKTGSKRDLVAFSVFLACGAVYSILYVLGVKLSTPFYFMADIVKPISVFLMKILK